MAEFQISFRLSEVFNVSTSKQYGVKDVLSKQTVTVETMQLKRLMYEDPEGFVVKHFDLYCNLLKMFGEFDYGLKMSSFKVLLQASEKVIQSLAVALENINSFEEDTCCKLRNMVKMTLYLLCHFALAFETDIIKRIMAANVAKVSRKRVSLGEECSEWPEERLRFLVVVKKIFELPIGKLWSSSCVELDVVNFVTNAIFKLLENPDVSRDGGMKLEIFRFLGSILSEFKTGLAYSVKLVQLVEDFQHLPLVLAEGIIYFVRECSADTLISDVFRETTLLDGKLLVQNLTAAHSLSLFLVSICEECPEKVLPVISCALQFLEWESHVIRNCCLSIIGIILNKVLANENLSQRDIKIREELLEHLEAHLLDVNSFVRSKTIQVFKMLLIEKALASIELHRIGMLIAKRIQDKASNVRKNAMAFFAEFITVNQYACQIPLPVLKESFKNECEKLKDMQKATPLELGDADEEPGKDNVQNALIFEDSDDELTVESEVISKEGNEIPKASEGKNNNITEEKISNNESKIVFNDIQNENNKEDEEQVLATESGKFVSGLPNENEQNCNVSSDLEVLKKQQTLVNYLKNTLNFAEVIHSTLEPIQLLLYSSTQTDVLEAIEFMTTLSSNSVNIVGLREVLNLIRSKEPSVKGAALDAFKTLFLVDAEKKSVKDSAEIVKNLMHLLKGATTYEAFTIEEYVKYFATQGEIPATVADVLHAMLSNSDVPEEDKISILILLNMLTEVTPAVIVNHMDNLISNGLGTGDKESFQLALYTLKALININKKSRGRFDSTNSDEVRLPHDHMLVTSIKGLLIDGITNYEDDQWVPMANEAVACIFGVMEEPTLLCAQLSIQLAEKVSGECKPFEKSPDLQDEIPTMLLTRFLSFCGHVAIHYVSYLKIDYFAYLRRQENARVKRRRKSSLQAHVTSLHSSFSSPKQKSKRRQSLKRKYLLLPPVDEEATYEQIIEMCAEDVRNEEKLVGVLFPFVKTVCMWTLKEFTKEVQAAASLALTKFMLISEEICQENMQLFATVTEKSPEAYIRANMIFAMGDLATCYPNIVEPWTAQIFQRLKDSDASVREASIVILTHLILHDFVRVKGLIRDVAKCIADSNPCIAKVASYLFSELSKKGNVIYNIIPDIISSLSDQNSGVSEESFQTIMRYILQYIEKEKLVEGLVEKLCYRFADSSNDVQMHELTFCLSILTLNDKCYSKLMEFKTLLKEKMSDPVIVKYMNNITANAKKNDAKTAAELEAFRKELGI